MFLKRFLVAWVIAVGLFGLSRAAHADDLLDFQAYGDGPEKVIVLHDWLGDRSNYAPIRPYLNTGTFTYAFVDVRGYGGSRDIAGDYTAQEAAQDAVAVADELGWEAFHIIGHSMTGMVVQRVAANVPDRVKSLVATTPVGARGMNVDDETFSFFEQVVTDREAAGKALGLLTGNRLSPQWIEFKVDRAMNLSTKQARRAYLNMFDKEDFSSDVDGLELPVLAILGEHDLEAFQPETIEATFGQWYPNLEITVAKNAGHYPMQEVPVFYASTIEAFMKKHTRRLD